jgi:mannose-6-phosphate isomerase-like protein (cupin superfamily)
MSNESAGVTVGRSFWWQGALMTIKATAADTEGQLGLVEADFPGDFGGPPLHVHSREDEAFYVLDGEIRFRQGDEESVARQGDYVFGPRGVPHSFKVGEGGARALVLAMPAGLEEMFAEGGLPAEGGNRPAQEEYDVRAVEAMAGKYGWEIVGPPLS